MSCNNDHKWKDAIHIPIARNSENIYDQQGNIVTTYGKLEGTIPDTMSEDYNHIFTFEDAYIDSKYWGLVKIKEIKYEYTNKTRRSIMDIDARDFIEAILKDVESGVIEYVEKRFLR
jgi:hypothetical protein